MAFLGGGRDMYEGPQSTWLEIRQHEAAQRNAEQANRLAQQRLQMEQQAQQAELANRAQNRSLIQQLGTQWGVLPGTGTAGGGAGGTGGPGPVPVGGVGGAGSGGTGGTGSGGGTTDDRLYPQPFQSQWGQTQLANAPLTASVYGPQGTAPAAAHQRMLASMLATQQANTQRVNDLRQMGRENLGYAATTRALQQQDLENERVGYQNMLENQARYRNAILSALMGT